MLDLQVLLLTKKHILSQKLYEILKRDYRVEILNMDDVVKNRINHYTASFYGVDSIVFTTEFIWEIFNELEKSVTTKFLSNMFSISNSEGIKITYVDQEYLLKKEYILMKEAEKNEFVKLKKYVRSAIENVDENQVICVPGVYGISKEKDIINLIETNQVDVDELNEITGPVLADRVALLVSDRLDKCGLFSYPTSGKRFTEWFNDNYDTKFMTRTQDSNIRLHQEHCVFDLVYKGEASSYYREQSIAEKRIEIGRHLAELVPSEICSRLDYVTPVPRTGLYYAMGLAEGLEIPYREVLVKETYNERSFGMTSTEDRKRFIWKKLMAIPELVRGKRIAVVDEAIFTGTTLKVVCEMLWNCEVEEIYLCIPTPPCLYHCNYLVHPPRKMLLEYMNLSYLKEYFNVTGIFFQDENYFTEYNMNIDSKVCLECFYGEK